MRTARIVDVSFLEENFTKEELSEAGIYTSGYYYEVRDNSFVCGGATVTACDGATVTAYGGATVAAFDSATVEAFDSATVEAYGNSYIEDYTGSIRPQSDYAIVKDYYNHKIYVKKGKFEIVEVD